MSLRAFDRKRLCRGWGLAGCDEAGRGALAGPVTAGAVFLPEVYYGCPKIRRRTCGINDSKQLTPERRDEFFALIEELRSAGSLFFAVGRAEVEEIAARNIYGATIIAMTRALESLSEAVTAAGFDPLAREADLFSSAPPAGARPLVIDGKPFRALAFPHEGVVKGDGKSLAIAMASICAKVTRDRAMIGLDREVARYGFAQHKGYATDQHCEAIRRHGPCRHHRTAFLGRILGAA